MLGLSVWNQVHVNRSNRPVLRPGETIRYVRDSVGLYHGKAKISNRQSGRIYLTNQRIVYVDNTDLALLMGVEVAVVGRAEAVDKFFRSSPKVKVYVRAAAPAGAAGPGAGPGLGPSAPQTFDWVCRICSFNNHAGPDTGPGGARAGATASATGAGPSWDQVVCVSCGVPPGREYLQRAAASGPNGPNGPSASAIGTKDGTTGGASGTGDHCPKCTFINHPSLKYCEMCGSELGVLAALLERIRASGANGANLARDGASPGTAGANLAPDGTTTGPSPGGASASAGARLNIILEEPESYTGPDQYIKLSFRAGEGEFLAALTEVLEERKWGELMKRGGVNQNQTGASQDGSGTRDGAGNGASQGENGPGNGNGARNRENGARNGPRNRENGPGNALAGPRTGTRTVLAGTRTVGIAHLQSLSEQTRKNNELTLSSSLNDLENLMYKAQDLLTLSTTFTRLIKPIKNYNSHNLAPLTVSKTSPNYYPELSRHVSEYLINYKLTKPSSMITLQDLFAAYNRYLILTQGFGTSLISSEDFTRAVELFEPLTLPMKLHVYGTGLQVLKPKLNDNYSQIIVKYLHQQEKEFEQQKRQLYEDEDDYFKTRFRYFRGNTVSDISEYFNWSHAITVEELGELVGEGEVLVDRSVMGTFYYAHLDQFRAQFQSRQALELAEDKGQGQMDPRDEFLGRKGQEIGPGDVKMGLVDPEIGPMGQKLAPMDPIDPEIGPVDPETGPVDLEIGQTGPGDELEPSKPSQDQILGTPTSPSTNQEPHDHKPSRLGSLGELQGLSFN